MIKHLILAVSCRNSNATNLPESFALELTPDHIDHIRSLVGLIKQHGLAEIVIPFEEGTWSRFYRDEDELDEKGWGCRELFVSIEERPFNALESKHLHVRERTFYFSAKPTCADPEYQLITRSVAVFDLDTVEDFLDI